MRTSVRGVCAAAVAAALVGWLIATPSGAQEASAGASPDAQPLRCNEQQPEPGLIRGNWVTKARHSREEQQARRRLAAEAVRIREM